VKIPLIVTTDFLMKVGLLVVFTAMILNSYFMSGIGR
jgi:hypothetical protein